MFRFAKFQPTEYVIHYSAGKVKREGRGLTFFYWQPTSSIVTVSVSSADLPFVFNDVTRDFQTVTIQGQLTYRIGDPRKIAELLDLTVAANGQYLKRDFEKIGQRLINEAHTATTTFVASLTLKEALRSAEALASAIMNGLTQSASVQALGIQPLAVAIVAVSATPEMTRALEAEAREALSQEADMAIYSRRNNAVAEERKIKESELNTEIAVEEKRRQIRETQTQADIAVEEKRRALVDLRAENERKDADTKAYALDTLFKSVATVDWKTLLALSGGAADSKVVMAHAFRELAENAQKIGNLNITPDLLNTLLGRDEQS
ncbi:MAG TPA: SPFH domain-containing protein [Thermoanaerobaculia bacterium]|nr:SPFH domain-containing protein [Thermoanaerobaculia bacterium]